jgi:hypothetical protein
MLKAWAINFLQEQLGGGPVATNELQTRAQAAGIAWASLRRAKQQLGIEAVRESVGGAAAGKWFWSLPKQQAVQDAQTQAVQPPAAQPQAAQLSAVQAAQLQTAQSTVPPVASPPPRSRVITVKRPGVAATGPDEISHEQWESLGRDTARLRAFLQQRSLGGQNG